MCVHEKHDVTVTTMHLQNVEELKVQLARFQATNAENVLLLNHREVLTGDKKTADYALSPNQRKGACSDTSEETESASDCATREVTSKGESSAPTQTDNETETAENVCLQAGGCSELKDKDRQQYENEEPSNVGDATQAVIEEHNSVNTRDITSAEPNSSEDRSTDRTGTMSPTSFEVFKGFLVHMPEMNLPWESMRSVRKCTCGVTFSYSKRKVVVFSAMLSCGKLVRNL